MPPSTQAPAAGAGGNRSGCAPVSSNEPSLVYGPAQELCSCLGPRWQVARCHHSLHEPFRIRSGRAAHFRSVAKQGPFVLVLSPPVTQGLRMAIGESLTDSEKRECHHLPEPHLKVRLSSGFVDLPSCLSAILADLLRFIDSLARLDKLAIFFS